MSLSEHTRQLPSLSRVRTPSKSITIHRTTWVIGIALSIFIVLAIAWHAGVEPVEQFFSKLDIWLQHPHVWLELPHEKSQWLLIPTLILTSVVLLVMKTSPRPKTWSRLIVVAILLALIIRYMIWRSLSTLNLATPGDGVVSLVLYGMEMLFLCSNIVQLYLLLGVRHHNAEADRLQITVLDGQYQPTVDVLIPTYNEPPEVLRRTIIGCQAMDYPEAKKAIYLLDDKRRSEIQALAAELGCHYMRRPDNRHAKAGNLNHALLTTNGELVVVFDADFVPTSNFLTRTVGFFQDSSIGLLQTYQSFYNHDPIARNLGLEKVLTQEVEIFSRHGQVLRDSAGTAICSGSSFVVRRQPLEALGGFVTDSLSEDYFTAIALSAQGYRVVYLNERLSAGLSAETMVDHIAQRLRWARGTLQAFFIDANPITIRGFSILQRLAYAEGLFQWFSSLFRIFLLFLPLICAWFGIVPLRMVHQEWLYFIVPFYVIQLVSFSWLTERSRSVLLSDIYSVAQCFPIAITIVQTLLNPFSIGFRVTPKGQTRDRLQFNWRLAMPLIVTLGLSMIGLWHGVRLALMDDAELLAIVHDPNLILGLRFVWIGVAYNALIIVVALMTLIDLPHPDPYEWLAIERVAALQMGEQVVWGTTTQISEMGMQVQFSQASTWDVYSYPFGMSVRLSLPEESLDLEGTITQVKTLDGICELGIRFRNLNLSQQRQLVTFLFCRPGRWHGQSVPGELRSLWLALNVLFVQRLLLRRPIEPAPLQVSQV
ncbi:MAG: glycosyltransferase [Spirulina sp. SIO3F2]|nr:glycosyltransferase [Spirulina sp. SIO3F2]